MANQDQANDQLLDEQDIVQGGPGSNAPAHQDSNQGKRIKINGQEFIVDDEMAAALEAREKSFQKKLTDQGEELGELRQQVKRQQWQPVRQQPVQQQTQDPPEEDVSQLIFTEPKKAIAKIKDSLRQELRQEYLKERGMEVFWEDFFDANPDLKVAQRLARQIFQENLPELAQLTPRGGLRRLAELVRDELAIIRGESREIVDEDNPNVTRKPTHVESGLNDRAPKPPVDKTTQPKKPMTVTDYMTARREARRKATKL